MEHGHITKASLAIRFDKPLSEDTFDLNAISPGGYHVKTGIGKEYGFDFNWSSRTLDTKDHHIVWFEAWELDTVSFPEAEELVKKIRTVEEFPECYVYVDEELDVHPVELLHFILTIEGKYPPKKAPSPTPYLLFDLNTAGEEYLCNVTFKRKLLRTCQSFPQG